MSIVLLRTLRSTELVDTQRNLSKGHKVAPHKLRVCARVEHVNHFQADSSTDSKCSRMRSNSYASSWVHEQNRSSSAEPMLPPSSPSGRPAPLPSSFRAALLREITSRLTSCRMALSRSSPNPLVVSYCIPLDYCDKV